MASIVCQGLQTCLEPQPNVLRQKLSPPNSKICPLPFPQKPNLSEENQHGKNSHNENDKGGWSFIQALTNSSNNAKQVTSQTDKVYVHPLAKHSASALSSKSLEMCTESLGSETGSDTSSDEFSPISWKREKMQLPNEEISMEGEKMQIPNHEFSSFSWEKKKIHRYGSNYRQFPPPLTSFSGSDGVHVRPHREGGRLVIKAVTVSSRQMNFQTDRTNGRLRLSLQKECSVNCDSEIIKVKEVLYSEEEGEEVTELIGEEEGDEDDEGCCWGEELEGNGGKIGPSRCIEDGRGSRGMSNWGPFCVAIS